MPVSVITTVPTLTVFPTKTSSPIPTATTPTTLIPTKITLTSTPAYPAQNGSDAATFLNETYPDQSILTPGEQFIKTWKIKNNGTNSWNTGYSLVLDATPQNESLGSPREIHFPQDTPPGGTAILSVPLIAPTTPGVYSVFWKLQNNRGETFGVDGDRVWATIAVCESGKSCLPPITQGSSSSNGISATLVSFIYDEQSATVDFCMTMPNRNYGLDYAPVLLVDQRPAPFLEGGPSSPWNCMRLVYQVSAAEIEQAGQIILDIEASLRMSPPPGDPDVACAAARQNLIFQYPGLDFQCHFSMAGYYKDFSLPSNLTQKQSDQIIKDTIEGAFYGPWVLTIR